MKDLYSFWLQRHFALVRVLWALTQKGVTNISVAQATSKVTTTSQPWLRQRHRSITTSKKYRFDKQLTCVALCYIFLMLLYGQSRFQGNSNDTIVLVDKILLSHCRRINWLLAKRDFMQSTWIIIINTRFWLLALDMSTLTYLRICEIMRSIGRWCS